MPLVKNMSNHSLRINFPQVFHLFYNKRQRKPSLAIARPKVLNCIEGNTPFG